MNNQKIDYQNKLYRSHNLQTRFKDDKGLIFALEKLRNDIKVEEDSNWARENMMQANRGKYARILKVNLLTDIAENP